MTLDQCTSRSEPPPQKRKLLRFAEIVPDTTPNIFALDPYLSRMFLSGGGEQQQQPDSDTFGLPLVWGRHSAKRTKRDSCHICDTPFNI